LGFSKTLDHLKAAISLYMAFFNFVRVHQTLRVTPAMQAGLTDGFLFTFARHHQQH
jgi:hypothetical protein